MKLFTLVTLAAAARALPNAALEPADARLDFRAKLATEMRRDLDPRANSCTYYDAVNNKNVKGQCVTKDFCYELWGFWVNNRCPNDGTSIKCCMSEYHCTSGSQKGYCLHTGRKTCENAGGHFVNNRCPGGDDVKCCLGVRD